jgi:phosphoglycerate dehydrogenase-like enzyme
MVILLRKDNPFHGHCPRDYLAEQALAHGAELTVAEDIASLLAALPSAEVLVSNEMPVGALATAPDLAWIHAPSAGIEKLMIPDVIESRIRVTNSAGTMAPEVAEHALALVLAMTRRIAPSLEAQRARQWANLRRNNPPISLAGLTMGIAGYGHIGRELAVRARAFGMRVLGYRRAAAEPDALLDGVYGRERFTEFLGASDVIVSALPLTPATEGAFDLEAFRAMKRSAYFVNVGRGPVVDEAALRQALKEGLIAGAASDVFDIEPLPAGSPLWDTPNLVITPHVGGASQNVWYAMIDLVFRNLELFRRGEPLVNEVDKRLGY